MHTSTRGHITRRRLLSASLLLPVASTLRAQSGDTPIRLIVPFPAGGPTDLLARTITGKFATELGQNIVVENRGGAGGTIGSAVLAQAKPDGLTIGLGTNGTHGINSSLYSKLSYHPVNDFAPIGMLAHTTNVVLVRTDSKVRNLADLVAQAKAAPGKLTMGSAGNGTTPHLAGALFNRSAGIQTLHVPFKGSQAALTALVAGDVDYTMDGVSVSLPLIKAGRIRPIAVTSQERISALPDVPGMAELGYKDVDVRSWGAYFAPPGTQPAILQKMNAALNRALADPEVSRRLQEISFTPAPGPAAAVTAATQREMERWPAVVQATGARVD